MNPSSMLFNILRVILFAIVISIVMGVLFVIKTYAIDSSQITALTLQERVIDHYRLNTGQTILDATTSDIDEIVGKPGANANLGYAGMRISFTNALTGNVIDSKEEIYFNEDFFKKNVNKVIVKSNYKKYDFYRYMQTVNGTLVEIKMEVIAQVG